MEATEITDEADIIFSDSAAGRVAQLIKEEKNYIHDKSFTTCSNFIHSPCSLDCEIKAPRLDQ